MSNESFHVAIIGGLCLAQGLSKAGVSTAKNRCFARSTITNWKWSNTALRRFALRCERLNRRLRTKPSHLRFVRRCSGSSMLSAFPNFGDN
jgi:hypothetical protein